MKLISIYEAGLDGFWVHRLLEANGVESHVVDTGSIAVDRRSRRIKTDRVDAEKLLRTLMGWARGERQACSMVRPPSRVEEAERRLTRERGTLVTERVRHVNRIKGLLATQGVFDFEPMGKDRRSRLQELRCWDRHPLPPRLKTELVREVDRLELVIKQLREIEAERDKSLQTMRLPAEKLREPMLGVSPVLAAFSTIACRTKRAPERSSRSSFPLASSSSSRPRVAITL